MLVQYHIPQFLTGVQLDRFLAGGWFRNCHLMFRSQFLCLERDLYSVVNIRLPLENHSLSKRQRKIISKNGKKFTFDYGPFQLDDEKEKLFKQHKHRFKGFLFDSLFQFFSEDVMGQNIFDTKEVCVYDGDKLIAYSFFDEGKDSVASLLGIFDHDYQQYSLGIYTMLLEIQLAQDSGKKYYYPGYVLDKPSVFDYKLKLGEMEYYDWRMSRWGNSFEKVIHDTKVQKMKEKIRIASKELEKAEIAHQKILYPIFSLGYLSGFEDFVQSPVFITFNSYQKNKSSFKIFSYHLEDDLFALSEVERNQELDEMSDMETTSELLDKNTYCISPLNRTKTLAKSRTMDGIILFLIRNSESL